MGKENADERRHQELLRVVAPDEIGLTYLTAERDYLIDDHLMLPSYELSKNRMEIHDVVWGQCEIGKEPYDSLLLDLAHTPLFRRLRSVEQLTLGREYATMPNSTDFSRWQHIWGSLAFVRKMTEGREDIDPRQRMVLQLRTLLSDVGHTAFSHLGDWLFQGIDGGEDLHDEDLKELLSVSGVETLLTDAGFTLEETVFPETSDWVECPSPDLCVDRVDYGMREILRWGSPTIPLHLYRQELENPQNLFVIDSEGKLIVKNPVLARFFAAGFSILPTEHWAHPVHRLQLELLQSSVRAALIDDISQSGLHPRDAMYGVDSDFNSYFQTWDALFLNSSMKEIATWQRRIFQQARRADLEEVFKSGQGGWDMSASDWTFPEFPDPLQPYSWQSRNFSRPYPPHLIIDEDKTIQKQRMVVTGNGLQLDLPPLKARAIDPLVGDEYSSVRLSEIDPSYISYLQGQRETMAKSYRVTVLMRPDVAEKIVAHHEEAAKAWPGLVDRPRDPELLKQKIQDADMNVSSHGFDLVRES